MACWWGKTPPPRHRRDVFHPQAWPYPPVAVDGAALRRATQEYASDADRRESTERQAGHRPKKARRRSPPRSGKRPLWFHAGCRLAHPRLRRAIGSSPVAKHPPSRRGLQATLKWGRTIHRRLRRGNPNGRRWTLPGLFDNRLVATMFAMFGHQSIPCCLQNHRHRCRATVMHRQGRHLRTLPDEQSTGRLGQRIHRGQRRDIRVGQTD